MLKITYRKLTKEEIKGYFSLGTKKHKKDIIEKIASVGFLFAYYIKPLMVWALIAFLLKYILNTNDYKFILSSGLIIVFLIGTYFLLKERFAKPSKKDIEDRERASREWQEDFKNKQAQILHLKSDKVWEITDVEDFGPAYLYEVEPHKYVYACSQEFMRFNDEILPYNELILERLPNTRQLIKIIPKGKIIKPNPKEISINDLPINVEEMPGCEIIEKKIPNLN